jgi:hypothetical protein
VYSGGFEVYGYGMEKVEYKTLRYTCSHGHEYVLAVPAVDVPAVEMLDHGCDCRDGQPPGVRLYILSSEDQATSE